jgi:hypothetical protein
MLTTHHLTHHFAHLVGTGLVLVSLFGWFTVPAESASGVEPTTYRYYRDYRDYRDYRGYRDHRDYYGYQDYRWHRRPQYERPHRFTIHKGKKCQIRCERIWGTREYRCREYRC